MKNTIPFVIIFLVLSFSPLQSQDLSVEIKLMDCLKAAFDDGGVTFEKDFNGYESAFLALNGIEYNTTANYKMLFQKMANDTSFSPKIPEVTLDMLMKDITPDETKLSLCEPTEQERSYILSKSFEQNGFTKDKFNSDTVYRELGNVLVTSYSKNEFTTMFYKLMLFIKLEAIALNSRD